MYFGIKSKAKITEHKPEFQTMKKHRLAHPSIYFPKIVAVLLFVLLLFPCVAIGKPLPDSDASLAEKVYLQTDREIYSTRDTVWFKCIVTNAGNHVPTTLSGILHVELISPTEKVSQKKMLKLTNGIGSGFFPLEEKLSDGRYLIRAYTEWNRNFGSDFIFSKYIVVHHRLDAVNPEPISNVVLTRKGNKQLLQVGFDPLLIDSLHTSKLTISTVKAGVTEDLRISKGKGDKYWFDCELDDTCRFITLKMETENKAKYSKTILLDKDYIDLRFFPESGRLVNGIPARVGFKAVDVNGKGRFVSGEIVTEADSVLTAFRSNELGMGSFDLGLANAAQKYFARLVSTTDSNQVLLIPLPEVNLLGNTLSVERKESKIFIIAESNYLVDDSLSLLISCRGMVYFDKNFKLKNGLFGGSIPVDMLPEGIIAFTLLDKNREPMAERIYFNQREEERLQIDLLTDKDSYSKRENTELEISIKDSDGIPVDADLSVLVINDEQLGSFQNSRQNILSYFLLNSELKGEIENPGYYFNNGDNRDADLDALMLTQGWRNYLYSIPYDEMPFKPERNLSITGYITAGLTEREISNAKLTMMAFGDGFQAGNTYTDSIGRFRFSLEDEYGDKIRVVIQTTKESGKRKNYIVNLDEKTVPGITYDHISEIGEADSFMVELIEKDEQRQKVEDIFKVTDGSIEIGQVDVDGYRRSPESKRVIELAGEPDLIINGEELVEKEQEWSWSFYSVLMYNYQNDIEIIQSGFDCIVKVPGSDSSIILVDGKYDPLFMDLVSNIPTEEISSIDVIKCADNFELIVAEVSENISSTLIFCGSIININTLGGNGVLSAYQQPVGITKIKMPVFSTPKEFYKPEYRIPNEINWKKPDLRALIHWQPLLHTDALGVANTNFYNADNIGEMRVVVEAISAEGQIGYKELKYRLEGKEQKILIIDPK